MKEFNRSSSKDNFNKKISTNNSINKDYDQDKSINFEKQNQNNSRENFNSNSFNIRPNSSINKEKERNKIITNSSYSNFSSEGLNELNQNKKPEKNSLNKQSFNSEAGIYRNSSKDKKENTLNKQRDNSKSNSANVFDKLYLESYKKNDVKLLNEEIKKLSEMDKCTFIPNKLKK